MPIKIKLNAEIKKSLVDAIKTGCLYLDAIPELSSKIDPKFKAFEELMGGDGRNTYRLNIESRDMKIAILSALKTGVLIIPDTILEQIEQRNNTNPFLEMMKVCFVVDE